VNKLFVSLTACIVAAAVLLAPLAADAQSRRSRVSFIRDAEVENTIRLFATPLFGVAGLDARAVRVHLINDPSLNAFVAVGQNIFFHTGLLMRSETANQVIGVIAHETGHISGGHLSRMNEEITASLYKAALAAAIGLGAALATGGAGAAMAGTMLGLQIAERDFLAYSRAQESAADQAGLSFLERTGQSARGMLEFFEAVADQELLSVGRQDPYVRTHPLTTQRMDTIRAFIQRSRYANAPSPPGFDYLHARMRAKLLGYLDPARAARIYKESDSSDVSRYGRAIVAYRQSDLGRAVPLMDSLIAQSPNDPYYHEMKAQMLFEAGRVKEALPHYQRAVDLLPGDPLLRQELAHCQIEQGDPAMLKRAIENLNLALRSEGAGANIWHLMSIAYGRDGNIGMADLAQAERAVIRGQRFEARQFSERAIRGLQSNPAARQRAEDIKAMTERRNEWPSDRR